MFRKSQCRSTQHTNPDHRPMLPELRTLSDPVEEAIRDVRRRCRENRISVYKNWR